APMSRLPLSCHAPATSALYPLSLHDALPICPELERVTSARSALVAGGAQALVFGPLVAFRFLDGDEGVYAYASRLALHGHVPYQIGRAHVRTPVTVRSRMPSSACNKK